MPHFHWTFKISSLIFLIFKGLFPNIYIDDIQLERQIVFNAHKTIYVIYTQIIKHNHKVKANKTATSLNDQNIINNLAATSMCLPFPTLCLPDRGHHYPEFCDKCSYDKNKKIKSSRSKKKKCSYGRLIALIVQINVLP